MKESLERAIQRHRATTSATMGRARDGRRDADDADDDGDDDADDGRVGRDDAGARVRTLEEILRTLGRRAVTLETDASTAREERRRALVERDDARASMRTMAERLERERTARAEVEAEMARGRDARDDAERNARAAESDAARSKLGEEAVRKELVEMKAMMRTSEEAWRGRERELRDDAARAGAETTRARAELEEAKRRSERAESYANAVNARVTAAEREVDEFSQAVALSAAGGTRTRDLEERLAREEELRSGLENELSRLRANDAVREGELSKLRMLVDQNSGPDTVELRARLAAADARARDLVAALKYEERAKDEAIREMFRARAAAKAAEAHASRLRVKTSRNQALASVIQSIGDSLFDE